MTKTLVLVHGYLGSSMNWSPILFKLQKLPELSHWNFRAVDLLWHGQRQGSMNPKDWNLSSMVNDLREQLLDVPHFYALGHSFGLRPLLSWASQEPERILGLVAEDSSPEISARGFEDLRKIFLEVPVPFATRELAKSFFDQSFGSGTPLSRFLLSNIRQKNDGTHNWRFQAEPLRYLLENSLTQPLLKEWAEYPGVLHLIKGSTSKSFIEAERLSSYLKLREDKITHVDVIEGAGHWVHSEKPDAFVDCLVRILRSLESPKLSS